MGHDYTREELVSTTSRRLAAAGISELEERVYIELLERPGSTLTEVTALLDLSRRRAQTLLRALELKGLLTRSADRSPRYTPASPVAAVEALIAKRLEQLQETRLAATQLEEWAARRIRHATRVEIVEVLSGRDAVNQRFDQLEQAAQSEVLFFDRPPYYTPLLEINEIEREGMARGVSWRAVYAQEALELPGRPEHIRKMIELGEQARVFTQLPLKLEIVDRRSALVPLDLDDPELGGGGLVVRPSALLDALVVFFETIWERATPIRFTRAGTLDVTDESAVDPLKADRFIALLAAGLKDEAIARHLGISVRTFDRRIQSFMRSIDARTRFQAGYQAGYKAGREAAQEGVPSVSTALGGQEERSNTPMT